jgi:hypothetical protein
MTLAEAVVLVQNKLRPLNAGFWAVGEIEGFLEEGQQSMCARKGIYQLYTAAVVNTDTEVSLDPEVLSLKKLIYTKTGGTVRDQFILLEPSEYRVWGTYVKIYRQGLDGELELICTRRPVALSDEVDFEIPDHYVRSGCVNYAVSCCIYIADSASGDRFMNQFNIARKEWEQETSNESINLIAPDERPAV